jgi:hypothetical protein
VLFTRLAKQYFIVLVTLTNSVSSAATLPSRLPFSPQPKETIDPALEKWMREYAELIPVSEMTADQVLVWITDKDPVAKALIILESKDSQEAVLKQKNENKSLADSKLGNNELEKLRTKTIVEIPKIIRTELDKSHTDRSPLLASLFLEWLPLSADSKLAETLAEEVFKQEPINSCSAKSRAISLLTKEKVANLSADQIIEAIRLSKSYKSMTHRRRYLESLAAVLPESKRADVIVEFKSHAQDLPLLLRRFPWLQEADLSKAPQNAIFVDIGRHVRRKKCVDAESVQRKHWPAVEHFRMIFSIT